MSEEWSAVTSKKGRRKKGATHRQKVAQKEAALKRAKKAKELAKRGYNNQNGKRDPPRQPERPRLSSPQYRVLQEMRRTPDFFDCDEHLLSNIVLGLNLDRPSQLENKKIKVQILDIIVSEFQNRAGGKALKKKIKATTNGILTPISSLSPSNGLNGRDRNGERGRGRDQNEKRKSLKSGKFAPFYKWMTTVGVTFLDFLDVPTLCSMIRIGHFSFIADNYDASSRMNSLQRLKVYTSSKDIEYRLKQFNTSLNVTSSLKLYEFKRGQKVKVEDCLNVIMANGLMLDHRFRGKQDSDSKVLMDIGTRGMIEAANKAMKGKCKECNIWTSDALLNDLNSAYLVDFAEFQAMERRVKGMMGMKPPISAMRRDDEGERHLRLLDELVVDRKMIGIRNMQSVHCCYVKVLRAQEYELHSYLWVFIELVTPQTNNNETKTKKKRGPRSKEEKRQFIVWKGQCGVTKL